MCTQNIRTYHYPPAHIRRMHLHDTDISTCTQQLDSPANNRQVHLHTTKIDAPKQNRQMHILTTDICICSQQIDAHAGTQQTDAPAHIQQMLLRTTDELANNRKMHLLVLSINFYYSLCSTFWIILSICRRPSCVY